jgi:hypothetical protein
MLRDRQQKTPGVGSSLRWKEACQGWLLSCCAASRGLASMGDTLQQSGAMGTVELEGMGRPGDREVVAWSVWAGCWPRY